MCNPEDLGMYAECPDCEEAIDFPDLECSDCGCEIEQAVWDDLILDVVSEEDEERRSPGFDNEELTLCCNGPLGDCVCTPSVIWADVNNVDSDVTSQAYEVSERVQCHECIYSYGKDCRPFRVWLADYLSNGVIPDPIDGCKNFRSWFDDEEEQVEQAQLDFFNLY